MSILDQMQANAWSGGAARLLAEASNAADAARERTSSAAAELFPTRKRMLSETSRTAMTRLLAGLVAAVEDDLRQRLIAEFGRNAPTMLTATLSATDVSIAAPILRHAGMLNDEALIAVLLHRVEEQRLVTALRANPPAGPTLLDSFLQSGDERLAAAAMALIVSESRRSDAIDTLLLARTDLPAEIQHRLVWRVAAALRHYILARAALRASATDRALIAATTAALAGYDEGETLEGRAIHLARRLHQRHGLDDMVIRRAFEEGRLAFAVAALAVRASIDFAPAWDMAVEPGGSRLLVLLRAIGLNRGDAARIARLLAAAEETPPAADDLDARIAAFDLLDPAAAREAVLPWQFDAGFRDALSNLADGLAGGGR